MMRTRIQCRWVAVRSLIRLSRCFFPSGKPSAVRFDALVSLIVTTQSYRELIDTHRRIRCFYGRCKSSRKHGEISESFKNQSCHIGPHPDADNCRSKPLRGRTCSIYSSHPRTWATYSSTHRSRLRRWTIRYARGVREIELLPACSQHGWIAALEFYSLYCNRISALLSDIYISR